MNGILSAYSCDCLMSINELVNVTLSILLNSICNCRHSFPCIALDFIILYALTITSLFSISAIAIFYPEYSLVHSLLHDVLFYQGKKAECRLFVF